MEENIYKKLYYHAFNRYTELVERVQEVQKELEELYLLLGEEEQEGVDNREELEWRLAAGEHDEPHGHFFSEIK